MKKNFLFKIEKNAAGIEKTLLTLFVFLMIFLSFFQLIMRLFFHSGIIWMDIFLRYLVLNTAMISAALVTYEGGHFAMDAVFNFIKPSWHKKLKFVSNTFVLIISVLLAAAAARFVADEFKYDSVAFSVGSRQIKAFIFQLCMPVSFLLMFFHTFMNYFRPDKKEKTGESL